MRQKVNNFYLNYVRDSKECGNMQLLFDNRENVTDNYKHFNTSRPKYSYIMRQD